MTTYQYIISIISKIPELKAFESAEPDYFYDPDESALHVMFDKEKDADESIYLEPKEMIDGDLLLHTSNGKIVGFSILDTEIGREETE